MTPRSRRQLEACLRKRRHATRGQALDAALRCEGTSGDRLRVYRCPCCEGWHLTSRRARR